MESYSHLSPHERIRIEKLRFERRLTIRSIAAMIGRSPSTVSRETKRGLWLASNENESHRLYKPKRLKTGPWTAGPSYSALAAQRKAEQRAGRSRRPMRMDSNRLRAWVLNALRAAGLRSSSKDLVEAEEKVRPSRRSRKSRKDDYDEEEDDEEEEVRRPAAKVERKSRKLFARFIKDKGALGTARRIRHLQGHPSHGTHRPHPGQRYGIIPPPARGRGPAGHRRGDQRRPDENPRLRNTQRGMAKGDRAVMLVTRPNGGCCTCKVNPRDSTWR